MAAVPGRRQNSRSRSYSKVYSRDDEQSLKANDIMCKGEVDLCVNDEYEKDYTAVSTLVRYSALRMAYRFLNLSCQVQCFKLCRPSGRTLYLRQ